MRYVKSLALAGLLVLGLALAACSDDDDSSGAANTPEPTNTSSASTGSASTGSGDATGSTDSDAVTVELVAKDLKFDKDEITVPAGAEVTVVLDNQDASVPHNFSVYTSSDASEEIFKGELFPGVDSKEEKFTAPEAGEYFFRCDVHPDTMTGTLIAE